MLLAPERFADVILLNLNALASIWVTLLRLMVVSPEPWKARAPIWVVLLGSVIDFSESQAKKAAESIVFVPEGSVTDLRWLQCAQKVAGMV